MCIVVSKIKIQFQNKFWKLRNKNTFYTLLILEINLKPRHVYEKER